MPNSYSDNYYIHNMKSVANESYCTIREYNGSKFDNFTSEKALEKHNPYCGRNFRKSAKVECNFHGHDLLSWFSCDIKGKKLILKRLKQFKHAINAENFNYLIVKFIDGYTINYKKLYTVLVISPIEPIQGQIENKPTFSHFQHGLVDEISIQIFQYVESPLNLMLTCRHWYKISIDQQARAKWIIYKYGHAHALFYAIKFGQNFINLAVVRAIIANKAIISRYFVQRLLLHFGKFDKDLVALKMEYNNNSGRANNNSFQQNIPWANDLGTTVFLYILRVAAEQFGESRLPLKGNDMELFHFLSAGPYALKEAKAIMMKNLDQIGYHSICKDINGLVMQGAIIMLFSPASTANWAPPNPEEVVNRLSELIKFGFELNYTVIVEILFIERQLVEIGNTMIKAFLQILNESLEELLHKCLIELFRTFRLDKRLKKTDVLDFLYSLIEKDHEKVFFKAMNFDLENRSDDNNNSLLAPLKFPAFYYCWILNKFGADAEITDSCFEDILMKRVNVDVFIQQRNQRKYILSEQLEHNFKEIKDAFKNYFSTIKFFKPSHLKIIKQATHVEIIDGLRKYLTKLFMQQSQVSANCSDNMDIDNISTFTQKRKRYDLELNDWYNEIIKLHDDLNSFSMSGEFSEFLKNILELINGSNFTLSRDVDEIDHQRESKRHKRKK
ncbi:15315_t:CDS:2 [Cetraspora pellucida]|uniref:15315_t:CDS:1 n=1 Tax=Cetraspora pellucida TaxID=1433469 RepID=A0A9N9I0D9_9GLOM|nr:15315_t:CDS:2 [Cetraspora pellucida]